MISRYDGLQVDDMRSVDVDNPSKFFMKTSSTMKYNELYIQNTEAPSTDNPII